MLSAPSGRSWRFWVPPAVALAVGVPAPFIWNQPADLFVLTLCAVYVVATVGLNIPMGFTAQFSVAQAILMAIGGYTSALLTVKWEVPFELAFALAPLSGFLFGILLGLMVMRLRTHYLLLVTFGFHIVVFQFLVNQRDLTGGTDGLIGPPAPTFGPIAVDSDTRYYFLAFTLALLACVSAEALRRSKVGRAMRAVRSNELAAQAAGVNIGLYNVLAMGLSGIYAGISGSLFVHLLRFASPDSFDLGKTLLLTVMVVVGGVGSTWGVAAGTILIQQLADRVTQFGTYWPLVYGASIMVILIVAPGGLAGLARLLLHRLAWLYRQARRSNGSTGAAATLPDASPDGDLI